MSIKFNSLFILAFSLILIGCNPHKPMLKYNTQLDINKKYYVVYMAGQSNMVGLGDIEYLDNNNLPNNITFFNYSTDTRLKKLPYNFGPEVGLAECLNEEFPQLNFIFIKYAISGSSINEWLPNVSSKIVRDQDFGDIYGEFLNMANNINKNYNTQNLAFLWMQGETDAIFESTSITYEYNFRNLIENVRDDFKNPDLPILFGKVNPNTDDFKYVSNIQQAQKNIATSISNTYLIDTDSIEKQEDNLHYSSLGLLNLGKDYGDILCAILKEYNSKSL